MTQIQVSRQKLIITSSLNDYFLCDECGPEKQFCDKKNLQNHIRRRHKNTVESLIPIATTELEKSKEVNCNLDEYFLCDKCGSEKRFKNKKKLQNHIRRRHKNSMESLIPIATTELEKSTKIKCNLDEYFLCDKCGSDKQFKNKKKLQNHIKHRHKKSIERLNPIATTEEENPRNIIGTLNEYFLCDGCGPENIFIDKKKLQNHIRHYHKTSLESTPITTAEMKNPIEIKIKNEYFLCNHCGPEKRFADKEKLQNHISCHHDKIMESKITIASLDTEKPRKRRRSSRSTKPSLLHFCQVCQKKYLYVATLRYHIRKAHFNLISKTPYYQQKKVNQVWFEKVRNSDTIMEVHKTGVNSLVFRPLGKNTAIKVNDPETDTVDLSNLYPTFDHKKKVKCEECDGDVNSHALLKHKLKHQRDKEKSSLHITSN